VADVRIHGTTRKQVAAMFAQEQKALPPLPPDLFPVSRKASAPCRARAPRADCSEHRLRTMQVPWAAAQGRFALLLGSATRRDRWQHGPGFEVRWRRWPAPASRAARCCPRYLNKPTFSGPLGDRRASQPGRTLDLATPKYGRKSPTEILNTVRKMTSDH